MNVYWCGGEDIDFTLTGAAAGADGATFDSAWARASVNPGNGVTTWPLTNSISNPASFGNRSSFWVHASFYQASSNATTASSIVMALADSGGVARILVRGTGTNGQLKLSSRNAAGTITDFSGAVTASGAFSTSTLTKIDLFVNYSSSGQVTLYINGIAAADTGASINVTTDSCQSASKRDPPSAWKKDPS